MFRHKTCYLLAALLFALSSFGYAQENQIVHLENYVYNYIKLLQQRGYMSELNPTKLPYTRGMIMNSMENIDEEELKGTELYWFRFIKEEVGYEKNDRDDFYLSSTIAPGGSINNTISESGLRPQADKPFLISDGAMHLYLEKSSFAAQMGIRHDLFHFHDRRGETAQGRMYVRSEDFYIGFNKEYVSVYAGRYKHLWAPYNETSTLLGTNAHSFNNLDITLGNDRFKVTGFFGELDNISENGSFEGFGARDGIRRFLALHRFDVKISPKLRIGYFDGFLYSGKNAYPKLNYLMPTNLYFFERANNPDDEQFNYFFGGFVWAQIGKVTTNFQLMLDDVVINNPNPDIVEKTTFAITHSVYAAGIFENIDFGYESEFISYQTYNTDQAEGRYLYLTRGIANQFTDYILFKTYLNIHAHPFVQGLTLTPSVQYLLQGEQEINQTFVGTFEPIDIILTGTEEKVSRVNLKAFYTPVNWFWSDVRVGYNYTRDADHISGSNDSRFTFRAEVGFRFRLDKHSAD